MRQRIIIPSNVRSLKLELTGQKGQDLSLRVDIIPPEVCVEDRLQGQKLKALLSANSSAYFAFARYDLWVALSGGDWGVEIASRRRRGK